MAGSPLKRARREAAERAAAVAAGLDVPVVVAPRHVVVQPARLLVDRVAVVPGEVLAKAPGDLSFPEFRLRYFSLDTYWHHYEIINAIESARRMHITLVLCPPEHGKTTLLEDYICFRIARDPNIRITLVSESEALSIESISRVKGRMTEIDVKAFQDDWGPFHEPGSRRPWAAKFFTVDGANNDERDYTVKARPSRSSVAGTRSDLMLIDDVQSMATLSSNDKLLAAFRQDFVTRPGRQATTVIVGTRVAVGDFYEKILELGIVDQLVELPATRGEAAPCDLDASEGVCDIPDLPHEKPLCPEMWPVHDLAFRRKQAGESVWWRNFQQAPQRAGDGTFTPEMWLKACDFGRRVEPLAGPPLMPVILSMDPGMGRTGHTSLIASMLTPNSLVLLDMVDVSGFKRTEQMAELVREFCPLYRPSILIVESDAQQQAIGYTDRMEQVRSEFGFSIYDHRTGGEKADAVWGTVMMAGPFNQGLIRVPAGDQFSVDRFKLLENQLLGWSPTVDKNYKQDAVMALWFVWRYWTRMREVMVAGASNWSYRAMGGLRPVPASEALRR